MKPVFITTLLGLLLISGCVSFADQESGNYPKSQYGTWNNKSTTEIPLKPTTNIPSSYNEEYSILSSDRCLAYKKQVASHESDCQKHYDERDEINKCVIRRLINNGFTSYAHEYCGK